MKRGKNMNVCDDAKRQFKLSEVIILIVITLIIGFIFGLSIFRIQLDSGKRNNRYSEDGYVSKFIDNYDYIVNNYYGDLDKDKLIDSAIAGMLDSIDDPYTSYIDENSSNTFNISLQGSFQGIGVEVVNDSDNNVLVYNVIEDSPAFKAGIKSMDIIKSINGVSVLNMSTSDFVSYVKNSESSTFEIVLLRNDEEVTVNVERQLVTIKSIKSEVFERDNKKIGYIYMSIFANNTYSQFMKSLDELEKSGIDSLIIDVRSNTGGHLSSVENILGLFLDSSHVIYQTEDKSGIVKSYSNGKVTKKYPIVVLVNEASASASEILASALSEEYGAILVGKKTYGKGTVQELKTLPDGQQYKFTTKKWLTPKGNWINEKGVEVDVDVDFNKDYYDNPSYDNDNQLQSAIKVLLNK
jgi:carboxyl-terminal processing protease